MILKLQKCRKYTIATMTEQEFQEKLYMIGEKLKKKGWRTHLATPWNRYEKYDLS